MTSRRRSALVPVSALTAALTGAALLTAAVPAQAAGPQSVEVVGDTILMQGTESGDKIYVNIEAPDVVEVSLASNVTWGALPLAAGTGCAVKYEGLVTCQTAGVAKVEVRALGGDDLVYAGWGWRSQNAGYTLPMHFYGGPGRDDLRGGPADDFLYGESGNDTQIVGDLGADSLFGGEGDDVGLRGEGTGVQVAQYRPDRIDGGPGTDTYEEARAPVDRAQFVSLDGVANDGSDLDDNVDNGAEEGDNILPTVENITGSQNDEYFVGSAAANVIKGDFGTNTILGMAGDDEIFVGVFAGNADGGEGDDEITFSNDSVILGGPGNDKLRGGGGLVDAGPGFDDVVLGDGNDTVRLTDGTLDRATCGAGADIVYADAEDILAEGLAADCELRVGDVEQSRLTATTIQLTIEQPGFGTLQVTVRQGRQTLGTARVQAGAAGNQRVTIPLSAKDQRRLAKLKQLPAIVQTQFTPAGGAPARADRRVTIKR
ncbi:MAG: calcium-binding protein [bacterium]